MRSIDFQDSPEDTPTTRMALERIHLSLGEELRTEGWWGVAQDLHLDSDWDLIARSMALRLHTSILGLAAGRRIIEWPLDWKQHLKQAIYRRMGRWPLGRWNWRHNLRAKIHRKLGLVRFARKEVQEYHSVCPHLQAGPVHNTRLCVDYLFRANRRGYDHLDFLVSKAHSTLEAGLQPVMKPAEPAEPFDLYYRQQHLDNAAHAAQKLLAEALNYMSDAKEKAKAQRLAADKQGKETRK